MAAPGAVAWVYEYASDKPDMLSSLSSSVPFYHKLSSSIWSSRNKALYAYRAEAAVPRSGQLFIDVDVSTIVSTSGALDDATIVLPPVFPSVSHITRTSAASTAKMLIPYLPLNPPDRSMS